MCRIGIDEGCVMLLFEVMIDMCILVFCIIWYWLFSCFFRIWFLCFFFLSFLNILDNLFDVVFMCVLNILVLIWLDILGFVFRFFKGMFGLVNIFRYCFKIILEFFLLVVFVYFNKIFGVLL